MLDDVGPLCRFGARRFQQVSLVGRHRHQADPLFAGGLAQLQAGGDFRHQHIDAAGVLTALRHGQGHPVGRRCHTAWVGSVQPGGERFGFALQVERATTGHTLAHRLLVETLHLMPRRHRQHQPFIFA